MTAISIILGPSFTMQRIQRHVFDIRKSTTLKLHLREEGPQLERLR